MNDNQKGILEGIQSHISSFDNKAGVLLSVIGIVFALALTFLDVFHQSFFVEKQMLFKMLFQIVFVVYIITAMVSISFFAMVIIPRKHRQKRLFPNYYQDIVKMDKQELIESIKEYSENEDLIIDQISINASICSVKHKWLCRGLLSMIPFGMSIIILTIMTAFAF